MVSALLGTGPRVAAQPGNAWPPRGVAACQGQGCAGAWAHRLGWRRRPPLLLDARWLGGTGGGLPVGWRPLRPQGRGPRGAARAAGPGQARACGGLPGAPSPRLVGCCLPQAGPRRRCHLPALEPPRAGTRDGGARQRRRPRGTARAKPAPKPLEGDTARATNPPSRETLQQHAGAQSPSLLRDAIGCTALAPWAATGVAVLRLWALVQGASVLPLGGRPPWADSADHPGGLWPSAGGGRVCGPPEHSLVSRA